MEALRVFDNFLLPGDLAEVRADILRNGFGTWAPDCQSVLGVNQFAGVGYVGRHDIILRALVARLGAFFYPREPKFRASKEDADKSYVHSDRSSGSHTCIVYLSEEKDERSGTGFYNYKPNKLWTAGLTRMPCYQEQIGTRSGEMLQRHMTKTSPHNRKVWELTAFVQGKLNRAVFFDSTMFHARLPLEGLGSTNEEARIVHVFHGYF